MQNKSLLPHEWNDRYHTKDTPWSAHGILYEVITLIKKKLFKGARILEIGCGFGLEAIELAKAGYDVTAIDISEEAIKQARYNAKEANIHVSFDQANILTEKNRFNKYDLVLDICVLHTFKTPAEQKIFTQTLTEFLLPKNIWISVSCISPDAEQIGQEISMKPPAAISEPDLLVAIDGLFAIESRYQTEYVISRKDRTAPFPARILLMRKL